MTEDIEKKETIEENSSNKISIKEMYYVEDLESKIHDMISDTHFIALRHRMSHATLFSILGRTHTELWHSNFIAWLLNPYAEHQLSFFPIKRLLSSMRKAAAMSENKDDILKDFPSQELIDTGWFDECRIMPNSLQEEQEFAKEKSFKYNGTKECKLDVSFSCTISDMADSTKSEKLLFICENKIDALESSDQTLHYADWAKNSACFPLYQKSEKHFEPPTKKALLFLTKDNKNPQSKNFIKLTYLNLMDDVLLPCLYHDSLSSIGKMLLEEYIHTLDRERFAVSELLKDHAFSVLKKHIPTFFSLLKVQLFNDLFCNSDEEESIDAKIDWLHRFCGYNKLCYDYESISHKKESREIKRRTTYISTGNSFGKPQYREFKKRTVVTDKASNFCIGDESEMTSLDERWNAYKKFCFADEKSNYAQKTGEKYAFPFNMLFNFLRDYVAQNPEMIDALFIRNMSWPGNLRNQKTLNLLITMGNIYYTQSKSWKNWTPYYEKIHEICIDGNKSNKNSTSDLYVIAFYQRQENKKAKVLLTGDRPTFYAAEDDTESVLTESNGYSPSKATKTLAPNDTYPWETRWFIKCSDNTYKSFKDLSEIKDTK